MGRKSLIFAALVVQVVGCAFSQKTNREDPFLPSTPNSQRDDRTPGSKLFGKANPDKDTAREINTSPTNDPFSPPVAPPGTSGINTNSRPSANSNGGTNSIPPSGLGQRGGNADDPQRQGTSGKPRGAGKEAFTNIDSNDPIDLQKDRYMDIRRRLDRMGVKTWTMNQDKVTNEYHFRCEVVQRNDPSKARVFEAKDVDDLLAMTAVVDSIEQWMRTRSNGSGGDIR